MQNQRSKLEHLHWPMVAEFFRRRGLTVLAGAVFVAYAIFLARNVGAYAGGADTADYLNNARLMSHGMFRVELRLPPGVDAGQFSAETFIPLGSFHPVGGRWMAPTHPSGLPLFVLITSLFTGWPAAPHVTMVLATLLGVLATLWLGREWGLPWRYACLPALLLMISPVYVIMSLHLMSDVPALVCVTVAIVLAEKSRDDPSWALAAGVVFGVAVMVRQPNFLALLPTAICLGLACKRWLWFGLGALPCGVILLIYNHAAFGHAFETGYGSNLGALVFGWQFVPITLGYYAQWVPVVLTPIGFFWLGLPWLIHRSPRKAMVLVVWIATFFGFYAACVFTHNIWWDTRYLLPAFPACLVGATWVIWNLLQTVSLSRKTISFAFILSMVAIIASEWEWNCQLHTAGAGEFHAQFRTMASWANGHLPSNAVVFAAQTTGSLYYYTPFPLVRADQVNETQWKQIEMAAADARCPIYAVLWSGLDTNEILSRGSPGTWTQVGTVSDVVFWHYERPAQY